MSLCRLHSNSSSRLNSSSSRRTSLRKHLNYTLAVCFKRASSKFFPLFQVLTNLGPCKRSSSNWTKPIKMALEVQTTPKAKVHPAEPLKILEEILFKTITALMRKNSEFSIIQSWQITSKIKRRILMLYLRSSSKFTKNTMDMTLQFQPLRIIISTLVSSQINREPFLQKMINLSPKQPPRKFQISIFF